MSGPNAGIPFVLCCRGADEVFEVGRVVVMGVLGTKELLLSFAVVRSSDLVEAESSTEVGVEAGAEMVELSRGPGGTL